jgi:hypothetical protein
MTTFPTGIAGGTFSPLQATQALVGGVLVCQAPPHPQEGGWHIIRASWRTVLPYAAAEGPHPPSLSHSLSSLSLCVSLSLSGWKMTSRYRRLPAETRSQAPRPGIVEDRSSSVHHHHCMRSVKTVSTFYHFPLENTPGNFPGIAGKFPGNLTLLPAGQTGASAPRTSE